MQLTNKKKRLISERNVSFEDIANDYFSECGECDAYPILQYHFEAFGNIFSINDDRLGKALSKLPKKKRDLILTYYQLYAEKYRRKDGKAGNQYQLCPCKGLEKIA